jgi:hypothetical protein
MLDMSYEDTWITRNMSPEEYREYLKSDTWKELKKKADTRDNFKTCYICGCTGPLDLHHLSYTNLNELRNVRSVCREHHTQIHTIAKELNLSVRMASKKLKKVYTKYNKEA